MANKKSYTGIRQDCEKILAMWNANPTFQLADLTRDQFINLVRDIDSQTTTIRASEAQQITARLKRQELHLKASDMVTRVRSMARGYFGPDTAQLKQTGHTIRSERKSPRRKAAESSEANAT